MFGFGRDDRDLQTAVYVLAAWVRSQRFRLGAALAGRYAAPVLAREVPRMPANLQPLIDEITAADAVIDSAVKFINGVPKLIADAVSAALANGATADQLKPVTDLGDTLKTNADALKDAVVANTPPAG